MKKDKKTRTVTVPNKKVTITIKKVFFFFLFVGVLLSSIFYTNYKEVLNVQKNTKPISNYTILRFNCYSPEMSSSIKIKYKNKIYVVSIVSDLCYEIENGNPMPKLYYSKNKDIIFLKGQYFNKYFTFVFIFIFIFSPLIGLYIYRNELDNHYSTM
jgi:hypothetical protein